MNKLWLQFLSYAGLLGISLVLQLFQPDLHAILCTQLPLGNLPDRNGRVDLPLNDPIIPAERIK